MRAALFLLIGLLAIAPATLALDEEDAAEKPNPNAEAGGIIIDPAAGQLEAGMEITITFPRAMVPAKLIDVADQPAPFLSTPPVEGTFLWKSQTEGAFTITSVVAGARHHFKLAPNLKDAAGAAMSVPKWEAFYTAPKFTISTEFDERKHLSAKPQVTLTTTYSVRLSEAAEHIYFQDRDSHERLPVEVITTDSDKSSASLDGKEFNVTPREPLPAGRAYDLIVNGLVETKTHQPLPYLAVFPAGPTEALKVEWVGGFNHALEEPTIRIKFNDDIDPEQATPDKIRIEPPVPEMKLLASGDGIEVTGEFDLKQRYAIRISPELKGERGYGLEQESRWAATFRSIEPCLVFPGSQVFLRARNELRFAFFQINTPAVTWRLASIPAEKLAAVTARVTEFDKNATDPVSGKPIMDLRTGFTKQFQTELLVDAFELPVVSTGNFDAAAGNDSVRRNLHCTLKAGAVFGGPYLLEASAKLDDGRVVGNRTIVCVSDYLLTQKRTADHVLLRVAKMSDGKPLPGVTVRALTDENVELARSVTDQNGLASFEGNAVLPPKTKQVHLFIADTPAGAALQFANGQAYASGSEQKRAEAKTHVEIITDRNLYRPGQVVKMKGIARDLGPDGLTLPANSDVHWHVLAAEGDRVVGEGSAALSAYGGWEGEWTIPENAKLGRCRIRCKIGNQDYDGGTSVAIEEYRVPLFSAVVETETEIGTAAHARVSSAYFHGAPNVGARVHWKATWTVVPEISEKDYRKRYNQYAEIGPRLDAETEQIKSVEGDTQLDGHGLAELNCESPFKDDPAVGRTTVIWKADLTSADGQSLTGGSLQELYPAEVRLGVKASEAATESGAKISIDAVNAENEPLSGVPVRVDLFHVQTKTAKEQIAPFVYRYRNTDQFTKVGSQEAKTPGELTFKTSDTGRYVALVSTTKSRTPVVSDETLVTGEAHAELPVENEQTFEITHRPEPFVPGEKAVLNAQAPFGGVAWVSVETNELLDTFLVPMPGNASRIEVPIKKEYAPNATVSVYLVRPGGDNDLPLERYAFSEIEIRRPDRELKIEPHLSTTTARPGETIRGDVLATSEGKPISDADLGVFAVDDAVLTLGEWALPDLARGFYRRNGFGVRTYKSLVDYVADIAKLKLTQKGFTIGDGGDEAPANVTNVRKEFRTLAFWNANLRTADDGKANFEFVAPDNLTTYRLVAIAQTKSHQFGGDASQTVKVSKPLLIDPALPRFLRDGDDVELRAVARQNARDVDEIELRCVTDASCRLIGQERATQNTNRDAPAVFRFRAHVADPALAPAKIRFEAVSKADGNVSDAVEITLPVQPPTILRKESVAGPFNGPRFEVRSAMPEPWKRGRGKLRTTISTTPWLPKITGLPLILDYPHGCFEQISTKLLGYSFLANLLAYLPDVQARDAEYRAVLERGMKQFGDSLLADGTLPYWPGGDTGNAFVTCQALWSVNESAKAGFTPPEGLQDKLSAAVTRIVKGQLGAAEFAKPFGLFVLSQVAPSPDLHDVAQELYLRRNQGSDEERALLALALHQLDIMPREQQQLLREISGPHKERAFNPQTFTSMTRAEAMSALAFMTLAPKNAPNEQKQHIRERMLALMDSSASLSTQENLWLLLAFRALLSSEDAPQVTTATSNAVVSKNERAIAWLDRNIAEPLVIEGLNRAALSFFLQAEYSTDEVETDRVDRGFRLERVVKNLTDARRAGTPEAPLKIGDQLLITYRVNTRKLQNYVALEDDLPAGLEVVNSNLAMVAKFFSLPPPDPSDHALFLSHSELRDRMSLLYFDTIDPGTGTYSVLARATGAGTFRWPATQVVPMYDSRFSGLSPSSVCVIAGE
ncbi:MAG: alpha-2-macroglobulin family protein [Chthoniobacterales bacterium]